MPDALDPNRSSDHLHITRRALPPLPIERDNQFVADRKIYPRFFKILPVSDQPLPLITCFTQSILDFQAAILLSFGAD